MVRFGLSFGIASVLASLLVTTASGQTTTTADDQLQAKREEFGGALALQYGIDNCDIETTLKQRNDVKNKIVELKQQTGMSGDFTQAQIKDLIGLKTDKEIKDFCTGLQVTLPGSIAGLLADKPPKEWSKPAVTAEAAQAPAPAPPPAAPAPAPAPAPAAPPAATPAGPKAVAGDWEVEPAGDTPGECLLSRGYNDKDDDNAENAVLVRNHADQALLVLSYVKWNFDAGEKMSAALVTSKSVINADANWTADKTGKAISTVIPSNRISALTEARDNLIVKFDNGDASFEIPRFEEALRALDACATGK